MSHPLARVACVQGDLAREAVDAVVNAAHESLRGGGGVDGALHAAAGPGLLAECVERWPDGCPPGEARLTGGHGLPARHVIHTVGPRWRGGSAGEEEVLARCHLAALELAAEHGIATLAFPAISCGAFGFPHARAARVAMAALAEGLRRWPAVRGVRVVLFDRELLVVFAGALQEALQEALGGGPGDEAPPASQSGPPGSQQGGGAPPHAHPESPR